MKHFRWKSHTSHKNTEYLKLELYGGYCEIWTYMESYIQGYFLHTKNKNCQFAATSCRRKIHLRNWISLLLACTANLFFFQFLVFVRTPLSMSRTGYNGSKFSKINFFVCSPHFPMGIASVLEADIMPTLLWSLWSKTNRT